MEVILLIIYLSKNDKAIKRVSGDSNKVDNSDAIDIDNTRFLKIKSAKSKNLI